MLKLRNILVAVSLFLPILLFSQKPLKVRIAALNPVFSSPCNDEYSFNEQIKLQYSNAVFYFAQWSEDGNLITFYKHEKDSFVPVFSYLCADDEYFNCFTIVETNIFLHFQGKLLRFSLNKYDGQPQVKEDATAAVPLFLHYKEYGDTYDNIYEANGKLILTNCSNIDGDEGENWESPPCYAVIVDPMTLMIVKFLSIKHDAIGLTHIPNYFVDVNYKRLLLVHALTQKAYVYDLENLDASPDSLGSFKLLNEGISSLPFSTRIISYTTNARELVGRISQYADKINRMEGGFFLNDSTVVLVEKLKGPKFGGKRVLHFFKQNYLSQKWAHVYSRMIKESTNPHYSKRYKFLGFTDYRGFIVKNNIIYMLGSELPTEVKSRAQLRKYYRTNGFPQKSRFYGYEILEP